MPDSSQKSFLYRPFTFDRVIRIVISTAMVLGGVYLINRLSSVLLPFLIAWLIAYMLEPLVQSNLRVLRTRRRLLPVLLSLSEFLLVVIVLGAIFLPSIFDEMQQVAILMRRYSEYGTRIPFVPEDLHQFLMAKIDLRNIAEHLTRQDLKSIFDLVVSFLSGGMSFLLGLFDWFLVVLYVLFIMIDYDKLLYGMSKVVPPRAKDTVDKIIYDVKTSMNHYFRGQALVALFVGILFSIGFSIVGLPLAVVLGLFIGLLNMVPYLQVISIPITTLLCIMYSINDGIEFWPIWWECMLVYVIVQLIQDLYLTPRIMGKAMGLNPAIILLSLSVWGSLLGFIGLIIALPLTTLLMAYYNEYIIARYRQLDQPDRGDQAG